MRGSGRRPPEMSCWPGRSRRAENWIDRDLPRCAGFLFHRRLPQSSSASRRTAGEAPPGWEPGGFSHFASHIAQSTATAVSAPKMRANKFARTARATKQQTRANMASRPSWRILYSMSRLSQPPKMKAPVMMDHGRGRPVFRGPLGGYLQTRPEITRSSGCSFSAGTEITLVIY
jgi:hypothetical protein